MLILLASVFLLHWHTVIIVIIFVRLRRQPKEARGLTEMVAWARQRRK